MFLDWVGHPNVVSQVSTSKVQMDPVSEKRRVTQRCGWSSKKLALEQEERKMRDMGGDTGLARAAWAGRLLRKENAVQTLAEEDRRNYVFELKSRGPLSCSVDGLVRSGDVVQLRSADRQRALAALPASLGPCGEFALPCRATAAPASPPATLRTAFAVYRNDVRIPSSVPLMPEECLYLTTLQGGLLLYSEPRSFSSFAPLSEHQEVRWAPEASSRVLWKVRPLSPPHSRYLQANESVALNHVSTNQDLTLESQHIINTVFGPECEVSASRGGEGSRGWQFALPYPQWIMPSYPSAKRPALTPCR